MERRRFLTIVGFLGCSPGCLSNMPEQSEESESTTTSEDCWPQFCEGTTIVEVIVSSDYTGEVILESGCRKEAMKVEPGETKSIVRQSDAETCDVVLTVDEQEAFDRTVQDYQSTTLRVSSGGDVTEETEEL